MANPKILDLDAAIGIEVEPVHTRKVKLFGQEWTVQCDLNSFALSDLTTGDPAAVVRFLDSMIIPEQRIDFRNTMSTQPHLTVEKLAAILNALVEAATERPTTQPSVSSPGAAKKTSPRKSAGSSTVRRVAG